MLSTKTKTLGSLAIMLCAIPLIAQRISISRSEQRLSALQSPRGTPVPTIARQRVAPSSGPVGTKLSNKRDFETLLAEWKGVRGSDSADHEAFVAKLSTLSHDELVRIMQQAAHADLPGMEKALFLGSIGRALRDTDPGAVFAALMEAFKGAPTFDRLFNHAGGEVTFATWAKQDPTAAFSWYRDTLQAGKTGEWMPAEMYSFQTSLFRWLVQEHPDAVQDLAGDQAGTKVHLMLGSLASWWIWEKDSNPGEADAYLRFTRDMDTQSHQEGALRGLANVLAGKGRFSDIQYWFERDRLQPAEKEIVATEVARLSSQDSEQAAAMRTWLRKAMPDDADRLIQKADALSKGN
ncbi:hypothetical protein [Luteolibacter sp. LG18]|uniref:hypothetical protein n=1 Tax=Luteolibacter sp. LG18 TaxID=2819286 RepID=UPI002B2BA0DD|nr:hypothetical protein llg_36630 [Luteolibacter sp. LG18]